VNLDFLITKIEDLHPNPKEIREKIFDILIYYILKIRNLEFKNTMFKV
jgi:hypothetical protein